eukprot:1198910-Rhodomonas_salina.5
MPTRSPWAGKCSSSPSPTRTPSRLGQISRPLSDWQFKSRVWKISRFKFTELVSRHPPAPGRAEFQ